MKQRKQKSSYLWLFCSFVLYSVREFLTNRIWTIKEEKMATIQQEKIRIRLKAFDRRLLDTSCGKIVDTANRTGATAIGPIPLPTKRRIYCLLRSPHIDKDSREHFEKRTHLRIIDIYQTSSKTIDALMKLDLPAGVDIEVKL